MSEHEITTEEFDTALSQLAREGGVEPILGTSGVPLLGVNLGSLGYLTDVPLKGLDQALEKLIAGDFHLETRSRVYCSVWRQGQRVALHNALNDLVVNMGPIPRALDMELFLDDFPQNHVGKEHG